MEEEKKEEPVVEETKKENILTKKKEVKGKPLKIWLVVIIAIFMLITFGLGVYFGKEVFTKKGKKTSNEPTPVEDKKESKVETVNMSEKEVEKLLSYLPKRTYKGIDNYSVYQNISVTPDMVNDSLLLESAISHIDSREECTPELFNANGICDFVVDANKVKEEIKLRYGLSNVQLLNRINGSGLFTCTLATDKYSCSNSGGGWLSNDYSIYFGVYPDFNIDFTRVLKVEKDLTNLYVYVAYINSRFINFGFDGNSENGLNSYIFRLYKDSISFETIVDDYLYGKDFYDTNSTFKDKLFDYVGDKYSTYKHTFKLNDSGSYTWVSTKLVK